MDTRKKKASLYRLAYGTSAYRRKKGLPGPLFDLTVLGLFAAFAAGTLM
jgi:hypothetical protein